MSSMKVEARYYRELSAPVAAMTSAAARLSSEQRLAPAFRAFSAGRQFDLFDATSAAALAIIFGCLRADQLPALQANQTR